MKKFSLLFALLTIISLNAKVLGIIRDTAILNLAGSDAVIIPFIKIWFVLPTSYVLVRVYSQLLKHLPRSHIFLLLTLCFCSFFAVFLYVLEPHMEALRATSLTQFLATYLPASASVFLAAIRDWPYTLFFIASEMWTVFMFSFLFWSFAAEVVTSAESKLFYGYFSLDFAGVFAGLISLVAGKLFAGSWHNYLEGCLLAVFTLAIVQVILYFKAYGLYYPHANWRKTAPKAPLGIVASLKDKEIFRNLFGMVFFFEFCDHFLDIIWKNQLRHVYPDTQTMGAFWSQFILYTGLAGVFVTLFISSRSLQRNSWRFNALVTPSIVLGSSVLLFTCFLAKELAWWSPSFVPIDHCILVIGTIQAAFLKITKCTFFDNTKELAFLSVPSPERAHCRGVCDTFASRFAKSSSALTWQAYAMIPGALQTVLPIGLVVITGASLWNRLALRLSSFVDQDVKTTPSSHPQAVGGWRNVPARPRKA